MSHTLGILLILLADITASPISHYQILVSEVTPAASISQTPTPVATQTPVSTQTFTPAPTQTVPATQTQTPTPVVVVTVTPTLVPTPVPGIINLPLNGATVSGTVQITITPPFGTWVDIYINGTKLESAPTLSTFTINWNSASVANGSCVIAVHDTNSVAVIASITVKINN